jgi:hypothetical protein
MVGDVRNRHEPARVARQANTGARVLGHEHYAFTAVSLMEEDLQPVRWVVPEILPEGVTILGGRPKMGKSWLALGLCIAVASGGAALGTKPVERGEVLYLALEDNKRRLQRRIRKILGDDATPEGLDLAIEWPRLQEGGAEAIEGWLGEHPDARLIVVDTLARFKPQAASRRGGAYDEDRAAIDPLIPLVAEHGVGMLLIHHLREMEAEDPLDMISGTAGLTGAADGALVMKRRRGQADAYLHADGRDIEKPVELALCWDSHGGTWAIAGDAEEYRMSQVRQKIREAVENADEAIGPKEVSEIIDHPLGATRQAMSQMVKDGQLKKKDHGKYVPPDFEANADDADILTTEG